MYWSLTGACPVYACGSTSSVDPAIALYRARTPAVTVRDSRPGAGPGSEDLQDRLARVEEMLAKLAGQSATSRAIAPLTPLQARIAQAEKQLAQVPGITRPQIATTFASLAAYLCCSFLWPHLMQSVFLPLLGVAAVAIALGSARHLSRHVELTGAGAVMVPVPSGVEVSVSFRGWPTTT